MSQAASPGQTLTAERPDMKRSTWIAPLRGHRSSPGPATARRRPRLELLEDRRLPAVLVVQTAADGPGEITGGGNGVYSATTLRAAIEFVNAFPGPDTIQFAPALAGGTVTLTQNDRLVPIAAGGPT